MTQGPTGGQIGTIQVIQTLGLYASSQTVGVASSTTQDIRSVTFRGMGVASVGMSAGEVLISVPAAGAASVNFSAGATSQNLAAVTFADSNGVSFGLSGSTITASHNGLTTAMASNRGTDFVQATAAFAGTNATGTIASSGISVSVAAQSAQTGSIIRGVSLSGNTAGVLADITSGTLILAGGNNVTLSQNGQSVTISGAAQVAQSVQTVGFYGSSQTVGQSSSSTVDARSVTFRGMGAVSVGMSAGEVLISAPNTIAQTSLSFVAGGIVSTTLAGSTLTISAVEAAQTNQSLGIYGSSQTIGQSSSSTVDARSLTFRGMGAVSVGMSAGEVLVSAPNTIAQTAQTVGIYASSQTVGQSSSSTQDARSLTVRGMGAVSVGMSAGELLISAPVGGAAIRGIAANGSTASENTVNFSNSNGVSFGFGAAGNSTVLTASHNAITSQSVQTVGVYASSQTTGQSSSSTYDARSLTFRGAGEISIGNSGGEVLVSGPAADTLGFWDNGPAAVTAGAAIGSIQFTNLHRSMLVAPLAGNLDQFPADITASTVYLNASVSGSTATMSLAYTSHFYVGIYTQNGSSLSLLNSASASWGSGAANANLSDLAVGQRFVSIHSTQWSSSPVFRGGSKYWIASFWSSAGALNQTGAILGQFRFSSLQRSGTMGVSQTTATSMGHGPWYGLYTATTGAFPNSIGNGQLNKAAAGVNFVPHVVMNQNQNAAF